MDGGDLWARWRPEIERATVGGHHTIEAIEADLASGRSLLWATPDCCIIAQFHRYPGGHFACHLQWAAGSLEAILTDLDSIEAEAKAQGCTEMLIDGRMAWMRLLQGRGYAPWSVTIRKEL